MIVLLQVASAPICSYRLAYLHACGQGGAEGLPGGAVHRQRMGKLRAMAIARMDGAVGGGGVGAGVDFVF